MEERTHSDKHVPSPPSDWVTRWSHLLPPGGTVLDIACGSGRHMQWFAQRGNPATGVDRSSEAIATAATFGETCQADIENDPWPLMLGNQIRQFNAVVVTNYLWRPLFPIITRCLAPGGMLLYETFSQGHQSVGRPSRPDFLLQPAELLSAFGNMRIVAFEEGFLPSPARFLQRIAAIEPGPPQATAVLPARYPLYMGHTS